MSDHRCPDCKTALLPGATKCGGCGWVKGKEAGPEKPHGICSARNGCQARATIKIDGRDFCGTCADKYEEYLNEKERKRREMAPVTDWREELIRKKLQEQKAGT